MTFRELADSASAALAVDPAQARRLAEAALRVVPDDPRARLILASALRRLGESAAALEWLAPLARAGPDTLLVQYEVGLALADLGETAASVAALRRAVSLDAGMADAWRALGEGLFRLGDAAAAQAAFAAHDRAIAADPVASAAAARFAKAENLLRRRDGAKALAAIEQLLVDHPDDPAHRNLHAACLTLIGDHAGAIAVYARLLAQFPDHPRLWLSQAHAMRTVGREAEANAAARRAVSLAPGLGEAWWTLASTTLSPNDQAIIAAQLDRPGLADDDRRYLHHTLGKVLEDAGDWAASFDHYARGAALRRARLPYDADRTTAHFRRLAQVFNPPFLADHAGKGRSSIGPVFIVGLPRSGSTLIEQILASHSAVEATQELPYLPAIAAQFLAQPNPATLSDLGQAYLDAAAIHRRGARPMFIDKMPDNFQHIGLIHLILPNARIIDARRHPLAAGLSAFRQPFAHGQAFTDDLSDFGRYYADYLGLMAHFDDVLPGRVHRVIYEDLVESPEATIRLLLDYCGLPFEESCLRFHETLRPVRTITTDAVRRPIFRDSLDHWINYEAWLAPARDAMARAASHATGD